MIDIPILFITFACKFKTLNMEGKDLNRLKLVLVEKKRTGVWLAEQLGVSAVTVSKWCSNITQPTLPNLNRIAEILDVDPRDLLNGRDWIIQFVKTLLKNIPLMYMLTPKRKKQLYSKNNDIQYDKLWEKQLIHFGNLR